MIYKRKQTIKSKLQQKIQMGLSFCQSGTLCNTFSMVAWSSLQKGQPGKSRTYIEVILIGDKSNLLNSFVREVLIYLKGNVVRYFLLVFFLIFLYFFQVPCLLKTQPFLPCLLYVRAFNNPIWHAFLIFNKFNVCHFREVGNMQNSGKIGFSLFSK